MFSMWYTGHSPSKSAVTRTAPSGISPKSLSLSRKSAISFMHDFPSFITGCKWWSKNSETFSVGVPQFETVSRCEVITTSISHRLKLSTNYFRIYDFFISVAYKMKYIYSERILPLPFCNTFLETRKCSNQLLLCFISDSAVPKFKE